MSCLSTTQFKVIVTVCYVLKHRSYHLTFPIGSSVLSSTIIIVRVKIDDFFLFDFKWKIRQFQSIHQRPWNFIHIETNRNKIKILINILVQHPFSVLLFEIQSDFSFSLSPKCFCSRSKNSFQKNFNSYRPKITIFFMKICLATIFCRLFSNFQ